MILTLWVAVIVIAAAATLLWYSKRSEPLGGHVLRGNLEAVANRLASLRAATSNALMMTELSFPSSDEETKQKFVEAWSISFECTDSIPEALGWIDTNELARLTQEFESIGFQRQLDYETRCNHAAKATSFCRRMTQRPKGCTGTIAFHQEIAGAKAVIGVSTEFRDGSRLSTFRRDGAMFDYLMRHPKRLVSFTQTGTPQEIFAKHLKQRAQVLEGKALQIQDPMGMSIEDVSKLEQSECAFRRAQFSEMDVREVLKEALNSYPGASWDWLG